MANAIPTFTQVQLVLLGAAGLLILIAILYPRLMRRKQVAGQSRDLIFAFDLPQDQSETIDAAVAFTEQPAPQRKSREKTPHEKTTHNGTARRLISFFSFGRKKTQGSVIEVEPPNSPFADPSFDPDEGDPYLRRPQHAASEVLDLSTLPRPTVDPLAEMADVPISKPAIDLLQPEPKTAASDNLALETVTIPSTVQTAVRVEPEINFDDYVPKPQPEPLEILSGVSEEAEPISSQNRDDGPTHFGGEPMLDADRRRQLLEELDRETAAPPFAEPELEEPLLEIETLPEVIIESESASEPTPAGADGAMRRTFKWPTLMGSDDVGLDQAERGNLIRLLRDMHDPSWCIGVLGRALEEEEADGLRPDVLEALAHSYHSENLATVYRYFSEDGNDQERAIAEDGLARLRTEGKLDA